jgi:hypothetical protein
MIVEYTVRHNLLLAVAYSGSSLYSEKLNIPTAQQY